MSFPATRVEHDEEAPRSQAAASLRAREILWYPTQSYKCKKSTFLMSFLALAMLGPKKT